MIEKFYLSHYRFTLTPKTSIRMPETNKGNVLRGAFGSSLRWLVCTMRDARTTDCVDCFIKERCAYPLIFSPVGINPARRLQNTPRGYVLKPPLDQETDYRPDNPLAFDMILIGNRTDYLPYAIVTLLELGKAGIGLNRGRFHLSNIEMIKDAVPTSIYDASSGTVKNVSKKIAGDELIDRARGVNPHELTLRFLTPTRIKYNPTGEKGKSEVVRVPEFHHLIRRLRDRVNALSVAYCGGPLDIDFKGIAERAMAVKTAKRDIRWVERRRKEVHDQSGFAGEITFEGDLTEFIPLLLLGEYVHVGDDAVFGNGWYRIENIPSPLGGEG